MSLEITKNITISAAFDKRHKDPSKNYGIHGCDLRFILGNEKGYVQFVLYTNWLLPELVEEYKRDSDSIMVIERYPFTYIQEPMPADLGYHSPVPRYDGQTALSCDLVPGGKCYYDGSGLNAIKVFDVLRREGSDGVWKFLENYHKELFTTTDETPPN